MENLPLQPYQEPGLPTETNNSYHSPDAVPGNALVARDQPRRQEDWEAAPSTEISSESWEAVLDWVCGDIEGTRKGIPHVGPLGLQRKFGFEGNVSQAVFEELQARGIVTKISIPRPGKGGVRGDRNTVDHFGGFMVVADRQGNSTAPANNIPERPSERPYPEQRMLQSKPGKIRRFLGKSSVTGAVADGVHDFAAIKTQRVAAAGDFLSRGEAKRHHDTVHHSFDRQYAEIFKPDLGMPITDENGSVMGTVVTSWMNSRKTQPWQRTVPALKIMTEDNPDAPQAQRDIQQEISILRGGGMSVGEIRRELLTKYHPDRSDGGDYDKAAYISSLLMKPQQRRGEGPAPTSSERLIQQVIDDQNRREASLVAAESAADDDRLTRAYNAGIAHLAAGMGRKSIPFTRMSPESFKNALAAHGVTEEDALATYTEFQQKGIIASAYTKDEGFKVLMSQSELRKIDEDIKASS